MPQMMPIYWLKVFFLNILVLLIIIILSNSFFNIKNYKFSTDYMKNCYKDFSAKWN